jgi:hypothetical protein
MTWFSILCWVWAISFLINLATHTTGYILEAVLKKPKPKFGGGIDPLFLCLWFPVLNTMVAIFILLSPIIYWWKFSDKKSTRA